MALSRPLLALIALCVACAGSDPSGARAQGGRTSFHYDNDTLLDDDSGYSAGLGLSWLSAPVTPESAGWLQAVEEMGPGEPADESHVMLGFGLQIFTPEDLTVEKPGPDDHPYSGLLALDVGVHQRRGALREGYTLRVGLVGPHTRAEGVQKWAHKVFNDTDPEGWDEQLGTEVVVNLDYDRSATYALDDDGFVDWTPHGAASLGTFATLASGGMTFRFGSSLPPSLPPDTLRAGPRALPLLLPVDASDERAEPPLYLFVDGTVFLVGRYLPLDGNNFRDSARVHPEHVVGSFSTGVVAGHGPWSAGVAYTELSDTYKTQESRGRYLSMTLSRRF